MSHLVASPARFDKAFVGAILEHPHDLRLDQRWTMQSLGLLGLWLDEEHTYRLHVWAPDLWVGPPVIHDHPFDFESTVIAGEMTNVRYVEDPEGLMYRRERYSPADETVRRSDTIRLRCTTETYGEGESYAQARHELHDSRQVPGTVTLLRMHFHPVDELTVCRSEDAPWVSGVSRPATPAEITSITGRALNWF